MTRPSPRTRHLACALAVASAACGRGASREGSAREAPVAAAPSSPVGGPQDADAAPDERAVLHRLRAHFRAAAVATRSVEATATTPRVAEEARWLVRGYEHVAEHFDTALSEWFDASAEADPVSSEFAEAMSTSEPAKRERLVAREVKRGHDRLVDFLDSPRFEALATDRELLREIRRDVESNEAPQVSVFVEAVERGAGERLDL